MLIKDNPLISVIIPVYNVKDYIGRMVDSIIVQTYSNLEIILVDDGSKDGSSEECDILATKDTRISVYHKPNGGVSSARNLGIEKAVGDYISFLDSDDTIEPDMYQYLLNLLKNNNCEASCCAISFIGHPFRKTKQGPQNEIILSGPEAAKDVLVQKHGVSGQSPRWLLPCRHVKNTKFYGLSAEDNHFLVRLLIKINYVILGPLAKYNYIYREGSLSSGSTIKNSLRNAYLVFSDLNTFFSNMTITQDNKQISSEIIPYINIKAFKDGIFLLERNYKQLSLNERKDIYNLLYNYQCNKKNMEGRFKVYYTLLHIKKNGFRLFDFSLFCTSTIKRKINKNILKKNNSL